MRHHTKNSGIVRKSSHALIAAAVLGSASFVSQTQATSFNWAPLAAGTYDFSTAANWTPSSNYPGDGVGSNDIANIAYASPIGTVIINDAGSIATLGSLTLSMGGTTTTGDTLTFNMNGTTAISGVFTALSTATTGLITVNVNANTTVAGNFSASAGTVVNVANNSLFTVGGGSLVGASLTISSSTLTTAGTILFNNLGTYNLNAGGRMIIGGTLSPNSTVATFNLNDATASITANTYGAGSSGGLTLNGSGNFTVTGSYTTSGSNSSGNISLNTTGTVTIGTLQIGRTITADAATTGAGTGFHVLAGNVDITNIQLGTANSNTVGDITGGTLTVSSEFSVGRGNTSRRTLFAVNGGTVVSTDAANGIVVGRSRNGTTTGSTGWLQVTSGTLTAERIQLGGGNNGSFTGTTATNIGVLGVAGGTTYIGSGGIVGVEQANISGSQIGSSYSINLSGGTLAAKADWSSSASMTLAGAATFQASDVLGTAHNITLTGPLSGTGSIVKTGPGTLTVSGNNTFSGGVVVSSGKLLTSPASGSALGTGPISISGTGTVFGGTGNDSTIGAVSVGTGSRLSPGIPGVNSGLGTLNLSSVNLNSGAAADFDLSVLGGDLITISNGLTIATGHGINLFAAGSTNPYTSNGTFNIFNITGGASPTVSDFQSGFSVTNPVTGATYTWGQNGTFITLTISGLALASQWNTDGSGSWGTAGNWTSGIPGSAAGDSATFGTVLVSGPATVSLNGSRTLGVVGFNNTSQSYTIAKGTSGALTLNNNTASAAVTVIGAHTISADVVLASDANISTVSSTDTLTLSGAVSGSKALSVLGPGKIVLTGNNSYGDTNISSVSSVQVGGGGNSGTLGNGSVTLGGSLSFNRSDAITVSNVLTGAGTLNFNGTGTVTLSGNNSLTGSTNVNAGKLILNATSAISGGALSAAGSLDLNGNSLTVASLNGTGSITNSAATPVSLTVPSTGTFTGVISDNPTGVLTLNKTGSGVLTLGVLNTFTGPTNISGSASQIVLTSSQSLKNTSIINIAGGSGTNAVVLSDGVVLDRTISASTGATFECLMMLANASGTYSGNLFSNGGQIRLSTPTTSTLTLTGTLNNAINAFTFLTSGNFVLSGTASINTGANAFAVGRASVPANLTVKDSSTITAGTLSIGDGGATNGSHTLTIQDNAAVSASGGVQLQGRASSGSVSTLNLNGGTLTTTGFTRSATTAGSTVVINLNGGMLDVRAAGATNTNFIPNGSPTTNFNSISVVLGANGGNLQNHDNNLTINAPLSGSGNFNILGTGVITLTTASNYTGVSNFATGGLTFSGNGVAHSTGALRGNALAVDAGTSLTIPASAGTSKVASLTIAGATDAWTGKINITNNILAIQTTGGAAKATALATLANQANAGKNGGTWDGNGITSSLNVGVPIAALATVDNADLGWTTTTDGQTLDANSLFVTRALLGDINLDGGVDLADYDKWYKNVGTGTAFSYAAGDLNMDGGIDLADYDVWYKAVGSGPLPLVSAAPLASGVSAVPEPASLAVLALGSAALLGSRRRRK